MKNQLRTNDLNKVIGAMDIYCYNNNKGSMLFTCMYIYNTFTNKHSTWQILPALTTFSEFESLGSFQKNMFSFSNNNNNHNNNNNNIMYYCITAISIKITIKKSKNI